MSCSWLGEGLREKRTLKSWSLDLMVISLWAKSACAHSVGGTGPRVALGACLQVNCLPLDSWGLLGRTY